MKKLSRLALFAGVLAFGVAACGDDVTVVDPPPPPPPPTPPLQVTMSPSNQSIEVDETAIFAVGVSGGEEGASVSVTCSSSNTSVAGVATLANGNCEVTGVAAGNASITATVTKGNLSQNAGGQVTVTAPPPPPALEVTMSPSSQTIEIGQSTDFVLNISGGDPNAEASWTCSSSDGDVASVSETDTGCRVTGEDAGSAVVTATVEKGDQSQNAVGQVTVTADESAVATVSIGTITKGGLTQPVDIDNVFGQIDVTLNVTPNDQTVNRVEVLVDGEVAAAQDITAAFEVTLDADNPAEALQLITLSFNTARYDVDEDALTATPHYMNGEREMSARIFVEETESGIASNVITLNFNNDDGFHILAEAEGATATNPNTGLFWHGGPEFELSVSPIPVLYAGGTLERVTLQIRRLQSGGASGVNSCGAAIVREVEELPEDLEFGFACTGAENDMFVPYIVSSVVDGQPGPIVVGTDPTDYFGVLNLTASGDHPFPLRIDVRGPVRTSSTAPVMRIVSQAGLFNMGNWVNAQYAFSSGFTTANVIDNGVGRASPVEYAVSTGTTFSTVILGPEAGLTAAGLEESVTNEEYYAWAVVRDHLGNQTNFRQNSIPEESSTAHPASTFGYDNTVPQYELAEGDDALGQIEGAHNIINQFAADDGIFIRATDNTSGFHQTTAATHAIVSTRGAFNGDGATERAAILTATPSGLSPSPFAAAAAGNLVANHVAVSAANIDHVTQTALEVEIDNLGGFINATLASIPARYYIYQIQLRDQAGNFVREYRAVYLNNNSVPVVELFQNPPSWTADAVFNAGIVRDSVEVEEGSMEIRYRNLGDGGANPAGTLVWERPTSELSSMLRMNADIQDGELFNDVIYRPQTNAAFPLGLDEHGLPFIRSIQTMVPASVATAKPDSARARIYNGWGVDFGDYHHGTTMADVQPENGISAIESRSIPGESVADEAIIYGELFGGNWDIQIVEQGVNECGAQYCVQAIGEQSIFTNPFVGGPVLILWTDDAGNEDTEELQWRVLGEATPNFSNPFPTRDAGADRIYEWTFSTSGLTTHDLGGFIALGALGTRSTGDALFVADFFDPTFNIVMSPAAGEVERGSSAVFTVMEGASSTGEGFTLAPGACDIGLTPGLTATVVGDTCVVSAGVGAPFGTYTLTATATGDVSGDIDAATSTVTVVEETFTIELTDAAEDVPLSGTDTFDFEVDVVSGTFTADADNGACQVLPTGMGATGTWDAGVGADGACVVTVAAGTPAGAYEVTVVVINDEGQQATDTATLTLSQVWTIEVTPDPLTLDWPAGSSEYTITNTGAGGLDTTTCSAVGTIPGLSFDDTVVGTCTVVIDDFDDLVEGTYNVEIVTTVDNPANTQTDIVELIVPERPEFAPVFDIETGPAAEDRREIERDRVANFVVIDGEGLGIDLVASNPVVVSPDGTGVAAIVTDDGAGVVLLEVGVSDIAQTGNYTITVTFVEEITGDTYEVEVFIRVIDTGAIEITGL